MPTNSTVRLFSILQSIAADGCQNHNISKPESSGTNSHIQIEDSRDGEGKCRYTWENPRSKHIWDAIITVHISEFKDNPHFQVAARMKKEMKVHLREYTSWDAEMPSWAYLFFGYERMGISCSCAYSQPLQPRPQKKTQQIEDLQES
jgi:hypothetical protein